MSCILVFDYSYANDPSSNWLSTSHDFYGEHRCFLGIDFGSVYQH